MKKPTKQKKKDIIDLIKEHVLSQKTASKRRKAALDGLTCLAYVITAIEGEDGAETVREYVDDAIAEALTDRKVNKWNTLHDHQTIF